MICSLVSIENSRLIFGRTGVKSVNAHNESVLAMESHFYITSSTVAAGFGRLAAIDHSDVCTSKDDNWSHEPRLNSHYTKSLYVDSCCLARSGVS